MIDRLFELLIAPVRWLYLLLWWRWRGWKISRDVPKIDRFVVTGAPHTSNWDYAHFLAGVASAERRPYVTIKKELFFPPLGWFLRALGGIPIDRGSGAGVVEKLTEQLKTYKRLILVFTPEGTRSYRDHWKTGFYYVAQAADVPIVMACLNYEEKILHISDPFYPTGDIEADLEVFSAFYTEHGHALYPEKVNDIRVRQRRSETAD